MVIPTNKKRLTEFEVALNALRYTINKLTLLAPNKVDFNDDDIAFGTAEHIHRFNRLSAVHKELSHIVETMKK
jgi:hypothetical protein